ncbi:hypothetical protein B0H16DRAFT_1321519 [Mycena metata]|uniref:Fungal N-terminal domain-containing protein n=1 Tax=Mycena metata TaxID=1033252 RepID=A0AAD7N4N4_9AGAR|nr:hypothetical protein B0H16DRAFT_1321519 [Mycena metata]
MSFGFGVGDIVLATSLAWRLYKGCKEASEGFRRMSSELLSLHAVLSETSDYLEEYGGELPESRKNRLNTLVDGCLISLQELEALYTRYESLTTQSQRTWDRMRYGLKDLSEVRQRLISSISMLTAFNTALLNSSTARIEKKLAKFIAEVQAGTRDGSVISASTTSLESPDVWDGLRRELEDIGISALVVEEHRDFIVSWLQNAMDHGLLEINAHIVDIDNLSIRSRSVTPSDDGMSSRSLTPTNDMDQDSIAPSELRVVMDAVTQAFSVESRNEHFDPTAASNGYAFSHPPQTAQAVTQLTTTRLQPPVHHEGVFSQDVDDGWSVLEDATARVALPSLTRDTASSVSGPSNVRQRSYSTSMMSSFIHEKDSDTFLPAQRCDTMP